MSGKNKEVATEVLNIDGHMHGTLTAIYQDRNVVGVSLRNDRFDRSDGAECIRHVGDSNQFCARRDQRGQLIKLQLSVVCHREPFQYGAFLLAQHMPRYDV